MWNTFKAVSFGTHTHTTVHIGDQFDLDDLRLVKAIQLLSIVHTSEREESTTKTEHSIEIGSVALLSFFFNSIEFSYFDHFVVRGFSGYFMQIIIFFFPAV